MENFISKFNTTAELATFSATTAFSFPHVALTKDDYKIHYTSLFNGHEYIDLGLPSGTKWAKMNLGATAIGGGDYYQYGKGANTYQVTSGTSAYSGMESPLARSADTAAQLWGGGWHIPTREQYLELIENTTPEAAPYGLWLNATNGASIYFPALGYYVGGRLMMNNMLGGYWTSTLDDSTKVFVATIQANVAEDISVTSNVGTREYDYGYSIRAVVG